MAGPLITYVWVTANHNILAKAGNDISIPIGSDQAPSAKEFLKAFESGLELDRDDAHAAQRVARTESGDAGRKAWLPRWTAKNKKKHATMLLRREKKIFRKIQEDYAAVYGRPILVSQFTGYNKDDNSVDFNLDPPLLARVTDTPELDLFHFAGDGWIDPYWNLERLEAREELYKIRSLWTFGPSYNLKTGETSPAYFRFADET